jgi:hypothetical protein
VNVTGMQILLDTSEGRMEVRGAGSMEVKQK